MDALCPLQAVLCAGCKEIVAGCKSIPEFTTLCRRLQAFQLERAYPE